MSVVPADFLSAAQSFDLHAAEIHRRNAISRAYYCALHAVNATLPRRKAQFSGSTHEALIADVLAYAKGVNPGRSVARTIAGHLPVLKQARKKADYELDLEIDEAAVRDSFLRTSRVLDGCQELARILALDAATNALPNQP